MCIRDRAIYYAIVLLVLLVINLVVMPWLAERQVQEVDYGKMCIRDRVSSSASPLPARWQWIRT